MRNAPWLDERYASTQAEPRAVVPKWDPLRRDLLPDDFPELEHLTPWTEVVFQRWPVTTTASYLLRWSLVAVLVVQLLRLLGAVLTHPFLVPVWLLASVALGVWAYLKTQDAKTALGVTCAIPLGFAVVLFTEAAVGSPLAQLAALATALGATGFLIDAVGSHTVATLLLRPGVPDATRAALRRRWQGRFRSDADGARASGEPGEGAAAQACTEELARYPLGFLLLPLVGLLALLGDALPLLLVITPAAALLWTVCGARAAPLGATVEVLAGAVESWTHYGLRGEGSPGVFASPAGARLYRLTLSATVLGLLAATLAPPRAYLRDLAEAVLRDHDTLFGLVLHVLGVWILPLVVLASAALAALGRLLPAVEALVASRGHAPADEVEATRWDELVTRLQESENPRHRRQLLLGYHATEHYPVFLPIPTLREHVHILGATGGGKTSRAVLPILAQLTRLPKRSETSDDEDHRGPIIVLDLKGEPYLFQAVRAEAARAGRTFRYFTNEAGATSHGFNPFIELRAAGLTASQVSESVRAALNLEHGTGYGTGYFSAVTRGYLGDLFERFPDVASFTELEALRVKHRPTLDRAAREREQQAYELISTLQLLARREALNVTPATAPDPAVFAERIAMARALDEDEVVYFFLRSHVEEAAVRYVASLAIECLYTACVHRSSLHRGAPKPAYVFIDEFQIVAGRNFQLFMQQARSSGLALILSNQSREDLEVSGLLNPVDQNTAYRQVFTARTPQALHFLEELAGETCQARWWEEEPAMPLDHGARFAPNDLIALSARDDLSLSLQAIARDYSQFDGFPIPLRSPHHITLARRDELAGTPWPAATPHTIIVGAAPPPVAAPARPGDDANVSVPRDDTALAAAFGRIRLVPDGYTTEDS